MAYPGKFFLSGAFSSIGDEGHPPRTPAGNGNAYLRGNPPGGNPTYPINLDSENLTNNVSMDMRLKSRDIPEWDGDPDTLAIWIKMVSQLATLSYTVWRQLGKAVPRRLTKSAKTWYWSLPESRRRIIEANWGTLRDAIKEYYMNRTWLDKQKVRANTAYYRDKTALRETPSEFYIRKLGLLELVYNYTDTELIMEIMHAAPPSWVNIINPNLYDDLIDFQKVIKYHEDLIMNHEGDLGISDVLEDDQEAIDHEEQGMEEESSSDSSSDS
jgi:hypothetical protein